DALPSGEYPAIEGARIAVHLRPGDAPGEELAEGLSDTRGFFAFSTPAEQPDDAILLRIRAEGCNARELSLDGRPCHRDLREVLYAELD
ncbi:MAG: hypothetical protein NZ990_06555, partial [Myxococcota bacterium]|nr:hypothetical protein [Myxococcota bacterium]